VLTIVVSLGSAPQARAATSEFRALWVDAFGEGIFNDAEVTKLVNAAKAANINALVVQVGRRGDCFCNRASMPRTQAGIAPRPYAAAYIAEMFLSVARNYDIDGLNFDRVRYPDLTLPSWPQDNAWGYNPVALDRFHAATRRTDRPLPNDPQWSQWRRDQVTNIVRKVYVEAAAMKPYLRMTADT